MVFLSIRPAPILLFFVMIEHNAYGAPNGGNHGGAQLPTKADRHGGYIQHRFALRAHCRSHHSAQSCASCARSHFQGLVAGNRLHQWIHHVSITSS